MFRDSAKIYDAIYSFKDYGRECEILEREIRRHKRSPGNALLDIACGSGRHIDLLKDKFEVEGLDLQVELLEVAKQRNPDVKFHEGDMTSFRMQRKFDVITCLFSAIGYVKTNDRLITSIRCMSEHLNTGGVLLIEPWFSPDTFHIGRVHAVFVDLPDLKIARMNVSQIEDGISILDFHYLVGTATGIDRFDEKHELGLFTHQQYMDALLENNLVVTYDPQGLTDRGLYVAVA